MGLGRGGSQATAVILFGFVYRRPFLTVRVGHALDHGFVKPRLNFN